MLPEEFESSEPEILVRKAYPELVKEWIDSLSEKDKTKEVAKENSWKEKLTRTENKTKNPSPYDSPGAMETMEFPFSGNREHRGVFSSDIENLPDPTLWLNAISDTGHHRKVTNPKKRNNVCDKELAKKSKQNNDENTDSVDSLLDRPNEVANGEDTGKTTNGGKQYLIGNEKMKKKMPKNVNGQGIESSESTSESGTPGEDVIPKLKIKKNPKGNWTHDRKKSPQNNKSMTSAGSSTGKTRHDTHASKELIQNLPLTTEDNEDDDDFGSIFSKIQKRRTIEEVESTTNKIISKDSNKNTINSKHTEHNPTPKILPNTSTVMESPKAVKIETKLVYDNALLKMIDTDILSANLKHNEVIKTPANEETIVKQNHPKEVTHSLTKPKYINLVSKFLWALTDVMEDAKAFHNANSKNMTKTNQPGLVNKSVRHKLSHGSNSIGKSNIHDAAYSSVPSTSKNCLSENKLFERNTTIDHNQNLLPVKLPLKEKIKEEMSLNTPRQSSSKADQVLAKRKLDLNNLISTYDFSDAEDDMRTTVPQQIHIKRSNLEQTKLSARKRNIFIDNDNHSDDDIEEICL